MFRPLALTSLLIILLPRETRPLPLPENILNDVFPEIEVHLPSLLLARARNLGVFEQSAEDEVVYVYPDRPAPVVFVFAKKDVGFG